jgi:hypothetical protein
MQGVLYEVAVETGDSKSLLLCTHLLYLACIVVLIQNVTMVIVNPSLPASVKVISSHPFFKLPSGRVVAG